jgi:5-methylcytosine-specific restriction protein A
MRPRSHDDRLVPLNQKWRSTEAIRKIVNLMTLPTLKKKARRREFDSTDEALRANVVKAWLFDGLTHRQIDDEILGLDRNFTKGFQSMGVLHFLGLIGEFRGVFAYISHNEAISLMNEDSQDFSEVIALLLKQTDRQVATLKQLTEIEIEELASSMADSSEKRRSRILKANKFSERISVRTFTYKRNPDIVAEALHRASGLCEDCKKTAPFKRMSDGSPYLEVHHILPLSKGGEDSLNNVLALCPNCHRKRHYG